MVQIAKCHKKKKLIAIDIEDIAKSLKSFIFFLVASISTIIEKEA